MKREPEDVLTPVGPASGPGGRSRQNLDQLIRKLKARRPRAAPAETIPARVRTEGEPHPLSFAQERLWFLEQLQPGRATYNIPAALRLRGSLSVPALAHSLATIQARHRILVARFEDREGTPVQVIAPSPAPLTMVDLRALPTAIRQQEARGRATREARTPFDLARQAPLRMTLLHLAVDDHLLLITLHHMVADGWSLGILVRELVALYPLALYPLALEPPSLGRTANRVLEPLPIQYLDYAHWQRTATDATARRANFDRGLDHGLDYWRDTLCGMPANLELPTTRPRPPVPSGRGQMIAISLPRPVVARLRALAKHEGATLFMTLMTAFQAHLSRLTGSHDFAVGTPVANRAQAETFDLIGLFVNTVIVRARTHHNPSGRDLLARVRETTTTALDHQTLPFETLVEALAPDRDLGRTPLFQVLFSLQEDPLNTVSLGALTIERETADTDPGTGLAIGLPDTGLPDTGLPDTGTAKFDLTLELFDGGDTVTGWLGYSTDLFDAESAQRLVGQFQRLVEALATNPDWPISELPIVTAAERAALAAWNQTETTYPPVANLHTLFAEQAAQTPDAVALVFEDQTLTFGDLSARAHRLALRLAGHGVGPEVLVGICAERSFELVIGLLAILEAGGAYVPLDPSYPRERLAFMLEDSDAPVLLLQPHLHDRVPEYSGTRIDLVAEQDDAVAQQAHRDTTALFDTPVHLDNLAYMIFTSGSTGRPKGAMNSHRAIINRLFWMQEAFQIGPGDRVLQKTPVSFDVSVWELFWPLMTGATMVLARADGHKDGDYLSRLIEAEGVTVLHFVPSMLQAFLAEPALEARCGTLRQVVCSGEALPYDLQERFFARLPDAALANLYGPTEAAVDVTDWRCVPGDDRRMVPIGRPIANTRIHILDHHLRRVPIGVPGQLFIAGVQLARGYHQRPGLTAQTFIADPTSTSPGARLYATGDRARWRGDGAIEFLGRIDHQVKIRGLRVELGEIESSLTDLASVREAVVMVRQESSGDRRLIAYVVAVAGTGDADPARNEETSHAETAETTWREALATRLPDYMVPQTFVVLDALPLNPSGKVDRTVLAKIALAGGEPDGTTPFVQPTTATEHAIAAIWQEILGVERVGLEDRFFDLGGHSLLATRVMARVRSTFAVELPLRLLFETAQVGALAAAVDAARAGGSHIAVPLAPRAVANRTASDGPETLPLSFAQERLWFLDQLAPGRAEYAIPVAATFDGPLDVGILQHSLDAIIERHETLRTTFIEVDGRPAQVITDPSALAIERIDLQGLETERRLDLARELAEAFARQPFDLEAGPLIRARLIRLAPERHQLILVLHHIIADGWSLSVLLRELVAHYRANCRGEAPILDPLAIQPLAIQYGDFSLWQRRGQSSGVIDAQLAYWRHHLAGLPPLEMPADRSRPAVRSGRGNTVSRSLPADLVTRLDTLARNHGATRFMALLALFQALLGRYSGQHDFAVGSPIAGRQRGEVEPLIGFFVNTLVLRADLRGRPSFDTLLHRVRQTCLDAYARQDVPFEQLVSAVAPQRDLSSTPLFQAMLALAEEPIATHVIDPQTDGKNAIGRGLTLTPAAVATGTAKFDLLLSLTPTREPGGTDTSPEGLDATLEYSADLFDATTAQRLLDHFSILATAAVNDALEPIDTLPMLAPAERQQLLVDWNPPTKIQPAERHTTLNSLVRAQAARTPDRVALIVAQHRLTYRQLIGDACRLAHHLRTLGVAPESRVAVCLGRDASLVISLLAVHEAGGAYVPLDPAYPVARLRSMLDDAGVRVLISDRATRDQTKGLESSADDAGIHTVLLDRDHIAIAAQPTSPVHNVPIDQAVQARNLAYLIYTSGSTGQPKGVAIEHSSAIELVRWAHDTFAQEDFAGMLAATSTSFDLSVFELFAPLTCGGCITLVRDALALADLDPETAANIRLVNTVPSAATELLRLDALPASVRTVNLAGEPLPHALAETLLARDGVEQVWNLYGPSEDTTYSTGALAAAGATHPPRIGQPLAGARAYVLDQALEPVPIGVSSELFLGGQGLGRGYLGRPAQTAERFVPDPFACSSAGQPGARMFRTGDRVRWMSDGHLDFLGRLDHQIKLRGFRIELGEIESRLIEHPAVEACCVVARPDPVHDETCLVGFVEVQDLAEAQPPAQPAAQAASLAEHLAEHLPRHMVPAYFVILETLPRTPNGKTDRRALVVWPLDDGPLGDVASQHLVGHRPGDRSVAFVAPRTEVERQLASLWQSLLGIERVGIHDDFFDLGGHSLLATRLVSRIRQTLEVELPLRALFEATTIAQLTATIADAGAIQDTPPWPPIEPFEREVGEQLAASLAQERLWFLDQLAPGRAEYAIPVAATFDGPLDVGILQHSLDAIIERHETLRTTFIEVDGQPAQVIADPSALAIERIDLQGLETDRRLDLARELAEAFARQPFDLEAGPLIRARLIRLAPERHQLILVLHHIIADGWSLSVLLRELVAHYRANCRGEAPILDRLPVQYGDFSRWQRRGQSSGVIDAQLAYWRHHLAGLPPLEMPADRSRPAARSGRGNTVSRSLPADLVTRLDTLARNHGATRFMALLALFQALLGRYSGQHDFAVGSPIAGRQRGEVEPLIGFFVNTLVLRANLTADASGRPSFETLLHRTRQTCLDAYARQDVPFEQLVSAVAPQRDLSSTPLFQAMLALAEEPIATHVIDPQTDGKNAIGRGLTLTPAAVATGTAKFDLLLSLTPTREPGGTDTSPEGLDATLEYSADLFDATTAQRLLDHFSILATAAVNDALEPIDTLPMLAPAERQQLLVDWNPPTKNQPAERHTTLNSLVRAQAARTPDRVALIVAQHRLTYRQLMGDACRLAHHLRTLGVAPESRVAVCLGRDASLVISLLAVHEAGGAYVPLDPAYPIARLRSMLDDAGVRVLISDRVTRDQTKGLESSADDAGIHTVLLDRDHIAIAAQPTSPVHNVPIDQAVQARNLAYLIYTSGSTGQPKGVAIEHSSAIELVRWAHDTFAQEDFAGMLAATSTSFDLSVFELFAPLTCGGCITLVRDALALADLDPETAADIRLVNTVPSAATELLRLDALPASVRTVNLAGEPLPHALAETLLARDGVEQVWNLYGPSEDTTYSTGALAAAGATHPPRIGQPLAGARAYVLDQALEPVPIGVSSELFLGGQGLARGYLGRPAQTAERFVPDPFACAATGPFVNQPGARMFRTGDRVRWMPEGHLDFLGRLDHQIKLRGFRVELGEIESRLIEHPAVEACCVVARPDPVHDETCLVGFVEVQDLAEAQPPAQPAAQAASLAEHLAEHLPRHMVPAYFVILETLPRTPNGKTDRRALVTWPLNDGPLDDGALGDVASQHLVGHRPGDRSVAFVAPRTEVERQLASLWQSLLGIERVGIHDDFFDLGGHSLLATRLVSRIRQTLEVELPLRALFEATTIAQLTATIVDAGAIQDTPPWPPIEPFEREVGEQLAASLAQERLWFLDQLAPGRAEYAIPAAVTLDGPLDIGILQHSLDAIIQRHETLRTTFIKVDGQPVQVIADPSALAIERIDLQGLETDRRLDLARELAEAFARQPFDLATGPLVRARLIRLAPERHQLILVLHHIIADGWSLSVLLGELADHYESRVRGEACSIETLPIQYADFARWQRHALHDVALDDQLDDRLAYWRHHLAGLPPLEMPTDRPRPAVRSGRGATVSLSFPAELTARLDTVSQGLGATRFMAWLALFQALLGRYSGQRDFAVGAPIAGRQRAEIEPLIGFFVNTLVLRADLTADPSGDHVGGPSFRILLGRTRQTCLDAYARQDTPFERLVSTIEPQRDLSRTPLFQAALSLAESPLENLSFGDLTLTPTALSTGSAKFDLALALVPTSNGIDATLEYSTDLFDPSTASRLLKHLRTLATAAVKNPDTSFEILPMLDEAEQQQIATWSGARADSARQQAVAGQIIAGQTIAEDTIDRRFESLARTMPDAVALSLGEQTLTYRQLDRKANALAHRLRGLGVATETSVALLAERSMAMITATLAVLKAGGCYVPLDPAYPTDRLTLMMADAAVRVVICDPGLEEDLAKALDGTMESPVSWLQLTPAGLEQEADTPPAARVRDPECVAYAMFTSGSSGRPKGVAVRHRGVVRLVCDTDHAQLEAGQVHLHFAPTTFDAATYEIWGALLNGAHLVICPPGRLSLEALGAEVTAHQVSHLFLTAGLFHQMVADHAEALASVRQLVSGGDVLRPDAVRRAVASIPGLRMINAYGPTENTVIATTRSFFAEDPVAAPVPIGRPILGTRVEVLDGALQRLPPGVAGELYIAGNGLARGYLQQPGLTAEHFVPDPYAEEAGGRLYRSGDRGCFRANGDLAFLGRIDNQVKIRGFRIEPGEVERHLEAHPEVTHAAVLVREQGAVGKQLVAYAVTEASAATLHQELAARMPAFMVPAFIVTADALPLTAHGKIDRQALASRPLPGPKAEAEDPSCPPTTLTETTIAGLFSELLETPIGSRDADFFALGGHSLLATRLVSRLRESLGVEVPLDTLFAHSTVVGLARAIHDGAVSAASDRPSAVLAPANLPEGTPRPLSYAQERLWFLDRFEPGSAAYNIPIAVRLRGPLDRRALDHSLREVVRRHEILRTTYGSDDGTPTQRVEPLAESVLVIDDRHGWSHELREEAVPITVAEESTVAFDLSRGPVFRARLFCVGDDDHVLLFTVHHIAADGWSIGVLVRELNALYRIAIERKPVALAELPAQYADVASWQRQWLTGNERTRQLDYWRTKMRGAPPGLELPTDRPRPAVRTFRGGKSRHNLDAQLTGQLRALARDHRATLFMVLLAAFKVLLARMSGERDIVVGTPVAGRRVSEVENLIGMFLNTLVLRTDLDGDPTFEALIGRVRETAAAAYAHQDVPFEMLLEVLQPTRDLSRTPLFQVFFNMVNMPRVDLALPGLEAEYLAPPQLPSKFDLTLYVEEPADGTLHFELAFNADLIDPPRADEMLRQLETVLFQVAARPDQSIERLTLVTEEARRHLPDPRAHLSDAFVGSVPTLFARHLARDPDNVAVIDPHGSWTYADLDLASNRLANTLHDARVEPGQPVAIYAHRSASLLSTVLGVLKAGGAFILLDPAYPGPKLAAILAKAKPAAWLAMAAAGSPPPEVEDWLHEAGCPCITLPAWQPLTGKAAAQQSSARGTETERVAGDLSPAIERGPDDLAYLAFTSGSTGEPKGILGRHGPLTHFLPHLQEQYGLDRGDRYSMLSGLAHDPLHRDMFTPLCTGATLCIPDPAEMLVPGRLASWMVRLGITVAHLTPAMGQLLTDTAHAPLPTLPSLRRVFLVGDVLTRADVARLARLAPDVTSVNYYGTTETQRAVAHHRVPPVLARAGSETANHLSQQILPLGHGMRDVQLLVLDRHQAQAGVGEIGEICVRSPHLSAGYLNDPKYTADRFVTNPFTGRAADRLYRTGDLGRYRADGSVTFAGRSDHQIKIRGFRVELGEIEAQLQSLPGVHQAIVLAHGTAADRRLTAHVVAAGSASIAGDALRHALGQRLPAHMVPATVIVREAMPITPNGKIDRRALSEETRSEETRAKETRAKESETEEGDLMSQASARSQASANTARTPLERRLTVLLRDVLQRDHIGLDDNFFELGANSLLLARVHARLEGEIGQKVPLLDLFENPTVRSLANHLNPSGPQAPVAGRDDSAWVDQLKQGRKRLRRRASGAEDK